jgi:hypothetical protein
MAFRRMHAAWTGVLNKEFRVSRDPVTQPPCYWLGMTSPSKRILSRRLELPSRGLQFHLLHQIAHLPIRYGICGRVVEGSGGSDEKTGFALILEISTSRFFGVLDLESRCSI